MQVEDLETRQRLVQAAVELYVEDPASCTVRRAAQRAELDASEAYRLFRGRTALLKYHYVLCVLRYRAMIDEIEGFADFDLAEKFSNFVYTLFDLLAEEGEFVELTFDELIYRSAAKTGFQRQVEEVFAEFLNTAAALPEAARAPLPGVLASAYLRLLRHWLDDESEGAEETLALADRTIAFGAEALQSPLWTSGAELLRYLASRSMPIGGAEKWIDHMRNWRR